MIYRMNSRTARGTQRNAVSKTKTSKNCVYVCICAHESIACGEQKRALDPLDAMSFFLGAELQEVVSHPVMLLGTEFGSSRREQQVLLTARLSPSNPLPTPTLS